MAVWSQQMVSQNQCGPDRQTVFIVLNFQMSVTFKKEGLQDFVGLTRDVGATLVVAIDWAGTRPAPTFSDTP